MLGCVLQGGGVRADLRTGGAGWRECGGGRGSRRGGGGGRGV